MNTTIKVQTAFRLDAKLVERLKRMARKESKSLNALVEDQLKLVAPEEPEFPLVEWPIVVKSDVELLSSHVHKSFSEKELQEDHKLAYILSK